MAISKDRILSGIKSKTFDHFLPLIKNVAAEQLGKNVGDLEEADYKSMLDIMVNANLVLNKILVDEVFTEIKNNAEYESPSASVGLDSTKVTVTIPSGMVMQGTVPNPLPIPLSGNVVNKRVSGKVKKGNIK